MPSPTASGTRTSSWKSQAGHAFTRGQPVYLQSEALYALATASTGFDGLVGDIAVGRFELVTGGEVDRLSGLVVGQVYSLGTVAGALSPGTSYPIYKALSLDTVTLVAANTGTEGTDVVLPFTVSVTPLANAVPKAGPDAKLDVGWIPTLPYLPVTTVLLPGADGYDGRPGLDGEDGEAAPIIPGPAGAAGAPGRQGIDGLDGEDGEAAPIIPGSVGAAGAAGALGPQGIDGEDGEDAPIVPGPAGAAGAAGATGATGAQGPAGSQGAAGAAGSRGFSGDDGEDGSTILMAPNNPGALAFYERFNNSALIEITGATTATANRMHFVQGTGADYTITLPSNPAIGDVIGFTVYKYASATKQYKLDAVGAAVLVAGRTRYLVLLHSNVVVLQYGTGSEWMPLVLNLDTPFVDSGATTITATTTNPTKGAVTKDKVYWRRVGDSVEERIELNLAAGTAGTGTYLVQLPSNFTIDTAKMACPSALSSPRGVGGSVSLSGSGGEAMGLACSYSTTTFYVLEDFNSGGLVYWGSTSAPLSAAVTLYVQARWPITNW